MVILGLVILTVAGIMYIVSAGGSGMTTLAKSAIQNTLVGIVVILVAFMSITFILNTVFKNSSAELKVESGGLQGMGSKTWNFECP